MPDDAAGPVREWHVRRATVGSVTLTYLSEPVEDAPAPATPPLELRREGTGASGVLKCFLIVPSAADDELTFDIRWQPSPEGAPWIVTSSLGEGDGPDRRMAGTGRERLEDTFMMWGDLAARHHRFGALSTWWLSPPGFDVSGFTERLAVTYQAMSEAFEQAAHPYRVFLRNQPYRGANASAHPASFVLAVNPKDPLAVSSLDELVAHELVHEWLQLDGPHEEVSWFVEGAADYYSLVVRLRSGALSQAAFVQAVNVEAREAYASPRRHLSLAEADRVFFTDFLAHRLPYARGMFYLADLDARLRCASAGHRCLDDLVREVVQARECGHVVGVEQWCRSVGEAIGVPEEPRLAAMVTTGAAHPRADSFGPDFGMRMVRVPTLDFGFDPMTLVTRQVQGIVPDGAAERAGLREGDLVSLPRYSDIVGMNVGDAVNVSVERDGHTHQLVLPLTGETVSVPQWYALAPGRA